MGYLSCRAQSAVSTINSNSNSPSNLPPSSSQLEKPFKIQHFDYRDLEAATNGFSDQKLLGKGSHGFVYKAVLRGRHVAVKRPSRSNHLLSSEADNEIEILSKIQSPGLVNLVGFTNDATHRLLVVEFMSNGTLYDVLHTNPRIPNWGRRIKLALQTARAIDTLHSSNPPVIHRDVKSANVLIDGNFNARLGDFGLALRCHVDDSRLRLTPPAGTMGYLDPCYVTPDNLSTKLDVFSFGILLLEIISGRKAIDVAHSPPSIVDWAIPLVKRNRISEIFDPRLDPPRDPVVRKQLAVIAAKCVRSCRERRPAMKDVAVWLAGLSKLAPVSTWGVGFINPCLMTEDLGRPVEREDRRMTRDSRRVYSDLGFSSNLMELMAGTDEEAELQRERASGLKLGSERFSRFGNGDHVAGKQDFFRFRRNVSTGGSSLTCSKKDDVISGSGFPSHGFVDT